MSDLFLVDAEVDEKLIDNIKRAFKNIEDSLAEELKESAELQAQSLAAALAMPSDSIW